VQSSAYVPVGERLQELIAEKDWDYTTTARETGLSVGTIQNLVNGKVLKPHPKTIHKIATGFGKTEAEVLRHLRTAVAPRYQELLRVSEPLSRESRDALVRFLRSIESKAGRRTRKARQ